ncbi:MAG: hypothetical protein KAS72_04750 [Phycisphaerales bacterium]|nr:hypothetical protein [Phycisphaerales bacterium]
MTQAEMRDRHIRWPADRFYWALLDVSVLPRSLAPGSARRTQQLGNLFESHLPVPIDNVHAIYTALGDHQILACGAERHELAALGHALTLCPDNVPSFVGGAVHPDRLNMLTGEFEPVRLSRSRRQRMFLVAMCMIVCTVMLVVGFERRAQGWRTRAAQADLAVDNLHAQVLPSAASSAESHADLLLAELWTLEQTRADAGGQPGNAAVALANVLACWPDALSARTESIAVTDTTVTITAMAPSHDEADRLADAMRNVAGWSRSQPQITLQRNEVRITIRLRRERGSTAP